MTDPLSAPPVDPLSRRHLLRLAGGGAAGVAAATAVGGEAEAARRRPKVRARLDRVRYRPGQQMTLRIAEDLAPGRRIRVTDDSGAVWQRVTRSRDRQVWRATAARPGPATVKVRVLWPDGRAVAGRRYRDRVRYEVTGVTTSVGAAPLIGMSAQPDVWAQRVAEVGPGLGARRIFADLAAGPQSRLELVRQTHADGMLPVVSYKVGGDVEGAINGAYDAAAQEAAARLAAFGLPTAVTFWHEPHQDMTTAQYVAASRRLLPFFKQGELRVGPLLNGFLLDRQQDVFGEYCPDELFELWDWVGIDTYQLGSLDAPGKADPGARIYALSAYVRSRGYDLPLGVGEYNGFTAAAIASAGEALLSTPNVWFGCVWNSQLERDYVLSGDRLAAFRSTLADARVAKPRPV